MPTNDLPDPEPTQPEGVYDACPLGPNCPDWIEGTNHAHLRPASRYLPAGPVMVVLAEVFPTERASRAELTRVYGPGTVGEYRGLWRLPTPERPVVHLFTNEPTETLTDARMELVASAAPGDRPYGS